jgi:hypothetical protein
MALRCQLGANLAKRQATSLELLGEGNRLRPDFSIGLATSAFALLGLLAVASLFGCDRERPFARTPTTSPRCPREAKGRRDINLVVAAGAAI